MLMIQGLLILTAGMGLVIVFLVTMILVMNASAVIIPRFNHLLPDPVAKKVNRPPVAASAGSADVAVAIAAVVARQRA